MHKDRPRISWAAQEVVAPPSLPALRRAVGQFPGSAMLESVAHEPTWGRYSVYGLWPRRVLTVESSTSLDPFIALSETLHPWCRLDPTPPLPFVGGWIGYLAYEAGHFIEPRAGTRSIHHPFPIAHWGLFDTALVHDHSKDVWLAVGIELPIHLNDPKNTPLPERLNDVARFVRNINDQSHDSPNPADSPSSRWNMPRSAYVEMVERALEYIRAGDIFQVNLARRLQMPHSGAPIETYIRLCKANPSTHAAYLDINSLTGSPAAILSSSPELFLSLDDGRVITRPIKGTRPRGSNADLDAQARRELAASPKDRAELNMIVDLERNDLGRICTPGSIRVLDDGRIETHPTVIHRTATITGLLRDDADAIDLLRATFPGGSITGAPKVRAMQIINELESDPRGPYCGCIGMIGLDGDLSLNLAIRTMNVINDTAELFVGSGIVADSLPDDEYCELAAKAVGMLAALDANPSAEVRSFMQEPHTNSSEAAHV